MAQEQTQNMSNNIISSNIFQINLATNQSPTYSIDKNKGIIKYGVKNDYPTYLLWLLNNHAEHGQIVRGKANYITGLATKPKEENGLALQFLLRANPFETWQDIDAKKDLDRVTFGGYYLKIESGLDGKPINWYHVPYSSVRASEDLCSFQICDSWKTSWNQEIITYPKFKEGYAGTSIFYFKDYTPSENKLDAAYGKPEYLSCTLDIDTDIRVGTFFNNYIKNNFSSGTMVIIPNGETDPKKQENIVDRIKAEHTGEDKAGNVVVVFTPKDGSKDVQVLSLNSNDLDKQYAEVSKRDKEKIIAGHGVTGVLFKIKTDDKALFSRSEIIEAHELFINEYVKPHQEKDLKLKSKWFYLKSGQYCEFEKEQIKLIGQELPLDNQNVINALNSKDPNIVLNYLKDKFSLEYPTADITSALPTAVQEDSQVNEHLKNLTGRQMQGLMRIVKKYDDKKLSKESAIALMKSGFGIDETMALTFLNVAEDDEAVKMAVKQSAQDKNKRIEELFLKYSHEIEDSEILEIVPYNKVHLATVLEVSITELRNGVLNQLKGNPFLTVDELAKLLQKPAEDIKATIYWLTEKKLVEVGEGSFQPTEKAMAKETEPIETEIVTEYTYEKRPDVAGPILLPTSREDCVKWVAMTRKRAISYDGILKLENEFGDSAWDFRGGFFNDNGEITPWCRHYWEGHVKIRKKK